MVTGIGKRIYRVMDVRAHLPAGRQGVQRKSREQCTFTFLKVLKVLKILDEGQSTEGFDFP